MKHAATLVLSLSSALLVAGCAGPQEQTPHSPPASPATPWTFPISTSAPTHRATTTNDDQPQAPGGPVHTIPGEGISLSDEKAARTTGIDAMRRFARPTLMADQWFADLRPLLTPDAAAAYAETDPLTVPATRLLGTSSTTKAPGNPYGLDVHVATDAGVFVVQMVRADVDAPWRIARFTFPTLATGSKP